MAGRLRSIALPLALVGMTAVTAIAGCSKSGPPSVQLSAFHSSLPCSKVAASRGSIATPKQSRLTAPLHLVNMTFRPVPTGYRPHVGPQTAWRGSSFVTERDARYQVFLARAWSSLGKRGEFDGQVFWVVLADGIAGPPTTFVPPGVKKPTRWPRCLFYGRGYALVDPSTGKPVMSSS